MANWVAAALIALALILGAALSWRMTGPVDDVRDPTSPGRLFVVFYLALVGVGSVLITASGQGAAGAALAASGLLAFGLGTAVAAQRWGVPRRVEPEAAVGPLQPLAIALLAVVGLVALASVAVTSGVPFLSSDPVESRLAYQGHAFDLFRRLVPPAALVVVAIALVRRDRRDWALAVFAVGSVLLVMISLASRTLPLELAIEALLLAWWAGRRASRRVLAVLALVGVLAFAAIQLARVGLADGLRDPVRFAVERTTSRLLLIQPRTLELLVREIPAREPYFGGATYVRQLAAFSNGQPRESLGHWLARRGIVPGIEERGFATPGVLGELWANFGPLALGGMFLAGVGVQTLGRAASRLGPGAADRVFLAVVTVAVARTYATTLNGFLMSVAVILAWRVAATLPGWPPWLRVPARRPSAATADSGSRSAPAG